MLHYRYWFDHDGIAHLIEPGSEQELRALKDEREMQRILTGVLAGEKRSGVAEEGAEDLGDYEYDDDINEMEYGKGSISSNPA